MTRHLGDGGQVFTLADEADTVALGAQVAPWLQPGDVLLLDGDLGTGKTTFARSLIRILCGDPEAEVPSPTFTLVQTYDTPAGLIWHFDLYRLCGSDEVLELGWEEAVSGMALVEWPDRLGPFIPATASRLFLEPLPAPGEGKGGTGEREAREEGRRATLTGPVATRMRGGAGTACRPDGAR